MYLSVADKENSLKFVELLFDTMIEQARKGTPAEIDVDALAKNAQLVVPQEVLSSVKMTQKIRTRWFDNCLMLNGSDYLKKVKCPTLAFNDDKDVQVYADNPDVIRELVPNAKVMLMPGLNHLLQHAKTGEMAEYGEIRETISPDVLDEIVRFIKSL